MLQSSGQKKDEPEAHILFPVTIGSDGALEVEVRLVEVFNMTQLAKPF